MSIINMIKPKSKGQGDVNDKEWKRSILRYKAIKNTTG